VKGGKGGKRKKKEGFEREGERFWEVRLGGVKEGGRL
jgi:hypothetical protein